MKKISEVAQELNITVPAVYKRINRLKPGIEQFIQVVNGIKYIQPEGVSLLRGDTTPPTDETAEDDDKQIISILSQQLETLQGQLLVKDQQIANKDEQIRNMQVLLGQAQESSRLLMEAQQKKPGIFSRLLGAGKKQQDDKT